MTLKSNAVVDRISEGKAVILIESHKKEIIVDVNEVDIAIQEGDWLDLELDGDDNIMYIKENYELTEKQTDKIEVIVDRLKDKIGSKFKK